MRTKKHIKTSFISALLLFLLSLNLVSIISVSAQSQTFNPLGSSPEAYQCFDSSGALIKDPGNSDQPMLPSFDQASGTYFCEVGGTRYQAYKRPYTLQLLEIWFVRILYVVWGLIASLSFLLVMKLGYDYILTRGDVTKITAIRQRIINFIIGFALIFLAIPILASLFRLLGINKDVDCYNVNMPGFQFFFTDLCTDPNRSIVSNACSGGPSASGFACSVPNEYYPCNVSGSSNTVRLCYRCLGSGDQAYTWQLFTDSPNDPVRDCP